ncbi:MAG: hypothetical protein K0Q94_6379 [Paenibacillus sp.]|uniref:hypothetical protein n=1 Tax=Paenibacillus sp. GCM10012303 TaxID=3317340 RepID=UPI0029EBD71F|nr:hypothetical protein [Paenibacillus sp.]
MVRRSLFIILAVLVLLAAAAGAAVWYAKPQEKLDLAYRPLSFVDKALDMLQNRKLEVRLNEQELNDLLKKKLSEQPQLRPNVTIEGARFEQRGDRLTAHVNIRTAANVKVGAALDFALEWRSPDLIVRHTATRIRDWSVPSSWLQLEPIVVPISDGLPPLIAIREIRFDPQGIVVALKLP